MIDFFYSIIAYFFKNPIEFWGFITSVICVWLNTRENVWGWFFAIIAAALYFKFFYDIRLYGDMLLQVFFIGVSIYGWYEWMYGSAEHNRLKISHFPLHLLPNLIVVAVILNAGIIGLLYWMRSDLVLIDAFLTMMSLIAQWMMARKYLENWWVWIVADVMYVGLYAYKEAYLTSFLYFIFLGLATLGYFSWKNIYSQSFKTVE
jgi:nicotinamide mononucleotide transporter